jgi:hypothetical protein
VGKPGFTVPFVFVSERSAPLSAQGFSRMVERAAVVANLGIKAHAHMLRHACGYKLANDGHDTRAIQAYLGHRNIQNTTRYTALAPQGLRNFFEIDPTNEVFCSSPGANCVNSAEPGEPERMVGRMQTGFLLPHRNLAH